MARLIDRRRFMGNSHPFDAEVEYLEVNETTGQAWIDTGYVPYGDDIDYFLDFQLLGYYPSNANYPSWIRAYNNPPGQVFIVGRWGSRDAIRIFNAELANIGSQNIPSANDTRYFIETNGKNRICKVNGIQSSLKAYYPDSNTNTLFIFSDITGEATITGYVLGRLYSFKLNKGGIPKLDLIPVRKEKTGYLYDRISGKLLGNAGMGSFKVGPDVS